MVAMRSSRGFENLSAILESGISLERNLMISLTLLVFVSFFIPPPVSLRIVNRKSRRLPLQELLCLLNVHGVQGVHMNSNRYLFYGTTEKLPESGKFYKNETKNVILLLTTEKRKERKSMQYQSIR
jgi:hypothetical protein